MSQSSTSTQNRRIVSRRPTKRSVKIICRKGTFDFGANVGLNVLDLSETGIRMLVKEPLNLKQQVLVTMESASHQRPLRHGGRVVWCMETAEKTFCVGIRFEKRVPYAELQKMT